MKVTVVIHFHSFPSSVVYQSGSCNIVMFYPAIIIRNRGGGAVGKSFCPASGRLGDRIPAATDLSRKNR